MKYNFLFCIPFFVNLGFAQPANDNCTNAEPISLTTENLTVNFFINNATLNNEEGCDSTTSQYADIWYSFTMPVTGNLYIDGNITWNNFGLYDACNGNLLACANEVLYATNISANTSLLLRVFRHENVYFQGAFQSFDIQAFQTATNDNCDASINIPLNQSLQETVNFNIGGSIIENNSGCSNNTEEYADVWYDFTMPFDGNLIVDGGILWNKFEIYDSCGGNSLYCGEDELFALGLTGNTNYKLRVYRSVYQTFTLSFPNFSIQAFEAATNDNCNTAEPLTITENPTYIPFNIGGSTIDNTTGCNSDVEDYSDVWFQFTLTEEANIIIDGNIQWNKFELYSDCNTSSIDCFELEGTFTSLTAGTYYLRVFRELAQGSNSTFASFYISKSSTLGTNNVDLSTIKVYPNPAKENLMVSTDKTISKLEIYNLLGQKVNHVVNQNTIEVSQLKSGMYLLKITVDNASIIKHVLIE